jgi:hypothetical protein
MGSRKHSTLGIRDRSILLLSGAFCNSADRVALICSSKQYDIAMALTYIDYIRDIRRAQISSGANCPNSSIVSN